MKRMILAILAGMLINIVLASAIDHVFHVTGVYPPYGEPFFETKLVLLALSYRAVITIFGAYMTAMIAREKAKTAVITTGVIGTILWLIGGIVMRAYGPAWYSIAGVVTAIPLVLIGWKLYEIRARNHVNI